MRHPNHPQKVARMKRKTPKPRVAKLLLSTDRFKTADSALRYARRRGFRGQTVTRRKNSWEVAESTKTQGPFRAVQLEQGVMVVLGMAV